MNASRASSTNASSHLVTSKHNAKCRRVPRIISRRLYCYRRKTAFQAHKFGFPARSRQLDDKDFSPELSDLSTLGETILNFLVKYPNRRSYSTDSDPLVQLRKEMNKTAYFNHNLMKRRYSVPETIMRKHKLQELLSKKSAEAKTVHDVKDESCQTEEIFNPRKPPSQKKTPKRKRDGFRYFKKSNTYCQYKSFLSQKKKYREIKSGSSATDTIDSYPIQCQSTSTSLPALVGGKKCCDFSNQNLVRQISAPSSNEEFEKLMVPRKYKNISDSGNQPDPSGRQLSAPGNGICGCRIVHPIRQSSAPSSSEHEKQLDPCSRNGKYFESPKRVHIKNCKSLDQNTSGYNTICGSLDEYTTPRKKTPESSKVPIIEEQEDRPKGKVYPITFHSESVFLHPCQQGFISHKEFHHISIQMVPENASEPQKTEANPKNDYYKTEIKLNVNDIKDQSSNINMKNEQEVHKNKPGATESHPTTPRDTHTNVPSNSIIPRAHLTETTTSKQDDLAPQQPSRLAQNHQFDQVVLFNASEPGNESEIYEDCSVPTNYPMKVDKSNLKIEVDVGNVDIPSNLHDILVSHKTPRGDQIPEETKPKTDERYNSKAALNYLFQKLGDSYPRRCLLKKPVFEKEPQFGKYYSELPKPDGADLPPKVLYNNQTYDILSANLLPGEWSNVSNPIGTDANDHLSDSDISIPDSLEDFQQTKYKYNRYDKYDEKLTRGDVSMKTNVKPNKHKGVAYFIPLLDSNKTKPIMPAKLHKKLIKRNENLSKHSSCIEIAKTSPRNKVTHKQIQTCLNVEDSLKKRRKKFAERKDQFEKAKSDKRESDLDEKIKKILLAGIDNVNNHKEVPYLVQHPSETASQSVQTENTEPMMSEYVEMFNMRSPNMDPINNGDHAEFFYNDNLYEIILSEEEVGRTQNNNFYRSFKKCRRIYYPNKTPESHRPEDETRHFSYQQNSNIPTFSGYQKKLKEFKQQVKKQNFENKGLTYPRPEPTNELLPLPYPRMKKGREKQKSKSITKIPGPKRFYQKFEAIPEELSNSSEGVYDFSENVTANNSDENNESTPDLIADDFNHIDLNDSSGNLNDQKNSGYEERDKRIKDGKEYDENSNVKQSSSNENGLDKNPNSKKESKSRKGRDSLSGVNEQEELITLSKGWINFYLLKGRSTEENNSGAEDEEDDNVAHSETIQIPQQYSIQVHARPEITSPNGTKLNSTLPGLCQSATKKIRKSEKLNHLHDTSLPDIPSVSTSQVVANQAPQVERKKFVDPDQANQLVVIHRDPTKTENSISTVTTSSNHSESPSEEPSGRSAVKKLQRYQRPHTYHSTRTSRGNHWSLTLEGSHDDKRPSADIKMQLSLKNAPNQYHPSNHSWKFTLKSENAEMSHTTGSMRRNINGGYLPHLNVNYKTLPSSGYQEECLTANFSENNSESNSTLSYSGRKYKLDSELLLQNISRLNNDLKFQIRKSDEDLTIRGSAITPERKPRVPTMSERDLTRMRLIRQTSADSRLL